jgi:hypothetical protein
VAKRIALVFSVLALVLAAASCGTTVSSTTPTGFPCTQFNFEGDWGCFYFISNGSAVPCSVDKNDDDLCTNTNGDFYYYLDNQTVLCKDQACDNYVNCSPRYTYSDLVNDGLAWQRVNEQTDQNTSSQPITTTFSSTSATTISTSASVDLVVNADALLGFIFASVHAQINASVIKAASTVVGNNVEVSVPAGKTAYGIYGVSVQVTDGHLYQGNSCGAAAGEINYGNVRTYAPLGAGWCVWISGQTPCRLVPGS